MTTSDWFGENDLSLKLDELGRLWKFRSTDPARQFKSVDAYQTKSEIVITLPMRGIQPGDVDLVLEDGVLRLRGRVPRAAGLDCRIGLHRHVELQSIRTVYCDGALQVRMPKEFVPDEVSVEVPLAVA